jgi:hypothetical protein
MAVFKNAVFYPETANFIQSAGITDETQMKAIGRLVGDLKFFNIWDKMKAVYPFVGQAGVSGSFQFNLKDPGTFKGTFSGGWTFSSTGATPDGSTGFMNTNLNPRTSLNQNSTHLSIYQNTNITGSVLMGVIISTSALELAPIVGGFDYNNINNSETGRTSGYTRYDSFILANRANPSEFQSWYKDTKLYTTSATSTLPENANIYISGRNASLPQRDTNTKCFASIGDGLTDTEAANFYTAVQRFQTTLGRQV